MKKFCSSTKLCLHAILRSHLSITQEFVFLLVTRFTNNNNNPTDKNLLLHVKTFRRIFKRFMFHRVLICHHISNHVNIFVWVWPQSKRWFSNSKLLYSASFLRRKITDFVPVVVRKNLSVTKNAAIWKNNPACQKRSVLIQRPKASKNSRGAIFKCILELRWQNISKQLNTCLKTRLSLLEKAFFSHTVRGIAQFWRKESRTQRI